MALVCVSAANATSENAVPFATGSFSVLGDR